VTTRIAVQLRGLLRSGPCVYGSGWDAPGAGEMQEP
jgi:hypothetical protein